MLRNFLPAKKIAQKEKTPTFPPHDLTLLKRPRGPPSDSPRLPGGGAANFFDFPGIAAIPQEGGFQAVLIMFGQKSAVVDLSDNPCAAPKA